MAYRLFYSGVVRRLIRYGNNDKNSWPNERKRLTHGITGALALILMAIHAAWAIYTYWKGNAKAKQKFSKFSIFVWIFWLIPYILGIVLGIK